MIYVDQEGNRYWFDNEPDFEVVRADLRPETPEEALLEEETKGQ